jgi:hypothetical protein
VEAGAVYHVDRGCRCAGMGALHGFNGCRSTIYLSVFYFPRVFALLVTPNGLLPTPPF